MVLCNLPSLFSHAAFSEVITEILRFCCKKQHCKFLVNEHLFGILFFFFPGWEPRLYLWYSDLEEEGSERGFFQCKVSALMEWLVKQRGCSQLTDCFTDFCLFFCRSRKEKAAVLCFSLKRSLFFLREANTKMTCFIFYLFSLFFLLLLKNQFPVKAEFWLQICRAGVNNCHYRKFWHP